MKRILFLGLLALASCNDIPDDEPVIQEQTPETSPLWTVSSSSVNFPKNFTVEVNNSMLYSTCLSPNAMKVTSIEGGRVLITFKHKLAPTGIMKFEIYDLGQYCDNRAYFHSDQNTDYRISFNRHVSVILDN